MPKSLTISSEQSGFPEYLEWEQLREAGIRHIADLSGKIWTDHNVHDPGITILEMLCYALTDLGYRTNFDITDLLARREQGKAEDNFFTAAEILGCNPLTPMDYRRLLIDIDGVRNAWLEPVTDTPISAEGSYLVANLNTGDLQILQEENIDDFIHHRININGYYRVYLELERFKTVINRNPGTPIVNEETILQKVRETLNEHRNFCEDFLEVRVLKDEEIGICADLELSPDADPNQVLQDLYTQIQEFLSPSIHFYTLSEMLDKGKSPDQVFEGRPPRLGSHGFIDTDELKAMEQRHYLYGSDLYQAILKDPRIRAIRQLSMSNFWEGPEGEIESHQGEEWVLELHPGDFRPTFSPSRSSIQLFKGVLPSPADTARAAEIFENRLSNFEKSLLEPSELDLPIPEGEYRELEDYFSIQHEFPIVYGIGEGGLSAESTAERKAQALQLQAYLTFFDQLLADYLAQLAHIRELFSFYPQTGSQATYFTQPLLDTPEGEQLIRYFNTKAGQEPAIDERLPYSLEETVARSAKVTETPEERDEMIRQTLRAFQNRTAQAVYPDEGRVVGNKYIVEPWSVKSLAQEELLLGVRPVEVIIENRDVEKARNEALRKIRLEVESVLLMRLTPDHFRTRDNDILMPNGAYRHEHSFRLVFQPNDYVSTLQALIEDEKTFQLRRDGFLDHLLGRFSEKFTDYTLLMYALNEQQLALPEIIEDKERFLQNYPGVSRNRGRGFDYTDLRLAEICQPAPLTPSSDPGSDEVAYQPEEDGSKGDYRFQLINLDNLRPLFVSYRQDYTLVEAEAEAQRIITHFSQENPGDEYRLQQQPHLDGNGNCLVIVRRYERTIVVEDPGEDDDLTRTQAVESIVAVYPELLETPGATARSLASRSASSGGGTGSNPVPDPGTDPTSNPGSKPVPDPGANLIEDIESLFRDERVVKESKVEDNTSGLERRVATLMGLDDWQRRNLNFLELSLEENKAFGFRVEHKLTGKVLLESTHNSYEETTAKQECEDMIAALKDDPNHPDYQFRTLPYSFRAEFVTTEQILGIAVNKDPNGRDIQVAVHPQTFISETQRNQALQAIQEAIQNDQVKCEAIKSDALPLFTLSNDEGQVILTGLIHNQDLEEIEDAVAQLEANEQADERQRLYEEKLNEFLRGFGSEQVEPLFYVDPYHEEYYDLHFVHSDFHVATHPGIYQHKLSRERALRRMQRYVENNQQQDMFMTMSWEAGEVDMSDGVRQFIHVIGPDGGVLLQSEAFYSRIEARDILKDYGELIFIAARDNTKYTTKPERKDPSTYGLYLEVPRNSKPNLRFKHLQLFENPDAARTAALTIAHDVRQVVLPDSRFLLITDQNTTSQANKVLFRSLDSFTELEAEAFFNDYSFRILEAAREYDQYKIIFDEAENGYKVIFTVPNGPAHLTMQFRVPGIFGPRVDAEQKADYLRQRARLFPVARRERSYSFFLYPNQDPPDFGEGRERVERRREWNFNWEDRIYWESVRSFTTVDDALAAYLGEVPPSGSVASARSGNLSTGSDTTEPPSFLARLRDRSSYNRTENQDDRGSRDDVGPFTLEVVDRSQILAMTMPPSLQALEALSDEEFNSYGAFGDAADIGYYRTMRDRETAFEEIERFLFREGFHVVEHILLSPMVQGTSPVGVQGIYREAEDMDNSTLLDKVLVNGIEICPDIDPEGLPLPEGTYVPLSDSFSSWATVVLPFWPRRFQNMSFRRFFEDTFRREAPAHAALRICWVDPVRMDSFEEKYKAWLKALFLRSSDLMEARNRLMKELLDMKNVYPDANLAVGEDNEDEGNMILDFTKLV